MQREQGSLSLADIISSQVAKNSALEESRRIKAEQQAQLIIQIAEGDRFLRSAPVQAAITRAHGFIASAFPDARTVISDANLDLEMRRLYLLGDVPLVRLLFGITTWEGSDTWSARWQEVSLSPVRNEEGITEIQVNGSKDSKRTVTVGSSLPSRLYQALVTISPRLMEQPYIGERSNFFGPGYLEYPLK